MAKGIDSCNGTRFCIRWNIYILVNSASHCIELEHQYFTFCEMSVPLQDLGVAICIVLSVSAQVKIVWFPDHCTCGLTGVKAIMRSWIIPWICITLILWTTPFIILRNYDVLIIYCFSMLIEWFFFWLFLVCFEVLFFTSFDNVFIHKFVAGMGQSTSRSAQAPG